MNSCTVTQVYIAYARFTILLKKLLKEAIFLENLRTGVIDC